MKLVFVLFAALIEQELLATATAHRARSPRYVRASAPPTISGHILVRRSGETHCSRRTYVQRVEALKCQEKYITAVKEEIAQSTCRNLRYVHTTDEYYYYDDYYYYYNFQNAYSLCDGPRDVREDLRNCSVVCSERQMHYLTCSLIGEELAEIGTECGEPPEEASFCLFDKGDFCFLKRNLTLTVLAECYATFSSSSSMASSGSGSGLGCSATCRQAVDSYRENSGCCVHLWREYSFYNGPTISEIFSACGMEIPEACTSLSPPKEFQDCAREQSSNGGAAKLSASVLILAGAQLGVSMV